MKNNIFNITKNNYTIEATCIHTGRVLVATVGVTYKEVHNNALHQVIEKKLSLNDCRFTVKTLKGAFTRKLISFIYKS